MEAINKIGRFVRKCVEVIFWPIMVLVYFGTPGIIIGGIVTIIGLGLIAICGVLLIGIFGGLGIVVAVIVFFIIAILAAIIGIPVACVLLVILIILAIPVVIVLGIWQLGLWLFVINPIIGVVVPVIIYLIVGSIFYELIKYVNRLLRKKADEKKEEEQDL